MRREDEFYPNYTAEIEAINTGGISADLIKRIIKKHEANAAYNKKLLDRYKATSAGVPILIREARFDDDPNVINNKINNDFFGEIIDFKTGYYSGKPIGYSYSVTGESEADTGGANAVDEAGKALTDFTTRNNMYDLDLNATTMAAICGYCGRLFYHDKDGYEQAMILPPNEVIILANDSITHPQYAVRYFTYIDLDDNEITKVEFYDDHSICFFEGQGDGIGPVGSVPNLYGKCPLQGIPNNTEMLGDAEKVIGLIDAYDRALSDANNESESFANAYMVFESVNISDEEIAKGQKSGAFRFHRGGTSQGKIYFLTKDINDNFIEHHLDRLEANIYRFSKTPNLSDFNFSQNASGVSLKFKLIALEAKCGVFDGKMTSAGNYMFQLLANSFGKKGIEFNPLQCVMDFHRNFPQDILTEAQAVNALIEAGLPKRVAYATLTNIEDIDYVMQLIKEEEDDEAEGVYGRARQAGQEQADEIEGRSDGEE